MRAAPSHFYNMGCFSARNHQLKPTIHRVLGKQKHAIDFCKHIPQTGALADRFQLARFLVDYCSRTLIESYLIFGGVRASGSTSTTSSTSSSSGSSLTAKNRLSHDPNLEPNICYTHRPLVQAIGTRLARVSLWKIRRPL